MPLDDIGSVRVNVGWNDNGRARMLFHQTDHARYCRLPFRLALEAEKEARFVQFSWLVDFFLFNPSVGIHIAAALPHGSTRPAIHITSDCPAPDNTIFIDIRRICYKPNVENTPLPVAATDKFHINSTRNFRVIAVSVFVSAATRSRSLMIGPVNC